MDSVKCGLASDSSSGKPQKGKKLREQGLFRCAAVIIHRIRDEAIKGSSLV